MTGTGQLTPESLETLVALSLLRLGTDTLVERVFSELMRSSLARERDLPDIATRIVNELGGEWEGRFREARADAGRALARARAVGAVVITSLDSNYPPRLEAIPDPPIVLWTVGRLPAPETPAVAVVGSRRATPTGLGVARRLSSQLAAAGVVVVSGLARGIDGAAHRGVLDVAGETVAVLGCGPDVVYPGEHRDLMVAIRSTGCIISEFPPGTRPLPRHFPLRNRIISGLSRAVVVVEASQKSGSLITARAALEQGRDVLAVPGSVASGTYRGCHALIKDGARLVETVDDILEEIGQPRPQRRTTGSTGNQLPVNELGVFLRLDEPVSVDELAVRSGHPAAECLAELTLLEVSGFAARTPGGGFVKLDGPATYIEGQAPCKREGSGIVHGEGSRHRRVASEGEDD